MEIPEIVKTDDGSDTLFVKELTEHFHSTFGAVQESMHIFIGAGLKNCHKDALTIYEVGFGTGLNAYLTLLESINSNKTIRYISIEKYPLPPAIWSTLNYPMIIPGGNPILFRKLHEAIWNEEIKITDRFSILKLSVDLLTVDYSELSPFDLVYFDAFSPVKQPELWETTVFRQISDHCEPEGRLVTYCAKGIVRRSLIEAGFKTERLPGPPGKREMLRGTKSFQ